MPGEEAARRAAKARYASDSCEFDPDARVSFLSENEEGAAWVQAWVYVERDAIEQEAGKE